ncbi:SPOR domain-containing protein [Undibacterium arcticum]
MTNPTLKNTRAKLALLGFEAQISERPSDSGSLYRVRIGPFGQIETMNRIRGKLSESGVDVAVVRSPK